MAERKLPLNNYSDSDDSDNQDSKLLPFDPDLLPNVPKQLPKVDFEPNSETSVVAAVKAAPGTNIIFKKDQNPRE